MSRTWGLLTILLSLRCETDSSSVKWMSPRWMMAASIENNCDTSFKKGWQLGIIFTVRHECYMEELDTWNDCTAQKYSPPSFKVSTHIKENLSIWRKAFISVHFTSWASFIHLMTEANDVKASLNLFKLASVSKSAYQVLKVSPSCLEVAERDERQSACQFFSIACQKLSGIPLFCLERISL